MPNFMLFNSSNELLKNEKIQRLSMTKNSNKAIFRHTFNERKTTKLRTRVNREIYLCVRRHNTHKNLIPSKLLLSPRVFFFFFLQWLVWFLYQPLYILIIVGYLWKDGEKTNPFFYNNYLQSCSVFLQETETNVSLRQIDASHIQFINDSDLTVVHVLP